MSAAPRPRQRSAGLGVIRAFATGCWRSCGKKGRQIRRDPRVTKTLGGFSFLRQRGPSSAEVSMDRFLRPAAILHQCWSSAAGLGLGAALILGSARAALAQSPGNPASTINGTVPTSEGNIWGGLDHQPTPGELPPGDVQQQAKINHKLEQARPAAVELQAAQTARGCAALSPGINVTRGNYPVDARKRLSGA